MVSDVSNRNSKNDILIIYIGTGVIVVSPTRELALQVIVISRILLSRLLSIGIESCSESLALLWSVFSEHPRYINVLLTSEVSRKTTPKRYYGQFLTQGNES